MRLVLLVMTWLALNGAQVAADPLGSDGLEHALKSALSRHPTVAGKNAELQAQTFAVDAARAQRYPSLSLLAQGRDGRNSASSATPYTARLRQPLWSFGRIEDGIRLAQAGREGEQADLLRLQRELLERTASAYAQVLGQRERLQIATENTRAHQGLLEQIQRRERGQLASKADVSLAATRLAQARSREQGLRTELEVARSELRALTQDELRAELPPPLPLLELPGAEQLVEAAFSASADLRWREAQIRRAEAALSQTRSADLPMLYLQAESARATVGKTEQQLSLVFEASFEGAGQINRHRSAQAMAQLEAARYALTAARSEVQRKMQRLQAQHRSQGELLELQIESVAQLGALLQSYRRQFEAGTKSWLDVLNIQRELFEQSLLQAQLRSERWAQALQIQSMLGGLDTPAGLTAMASEAQRP